MSLLALTAGVGRADTITIEWTFDRSEVRLEQRGEYTQVYMQDGIPAGETPGSPSLPTRFALIVIPAGAVGAGVSVKSGDVTLADNVLVWPAQPVYSTNDPPPAFEPPDPAAYASDAATPGELAVIQGTHRLHGYTLVSLRLNPVRYVPARGELLLATKIEATLSFAEPDPREVADRRTVARGPAEVARLVANPQEVERFAPPGGVRPTRDENAVYLLITSEALAPAFQALVDRRTAQGKPGTLLTTEWIYANYDGTRPDGGEDDQTRIRNCIADCYLNHATTWVLLGGDETIAPDRDCYVSGRYDIPTDLYYGGLDGSWDEDGDGIYGEAGEDEADLYPEVWVGRLPVRTSAHVDNYLTKVTAYEEAVPDGYANTMLLAGALGSYMSGLDRPSGYEDHDPVDYSEWHVVNLYRNDIQPLWQATPVDKLFNTISTWDSVRCGDYACSPSNLSAQLNQGYQHFFLESHGNQIMWFIEDSYFTASDAAALTNYDRPSIVFSVACSVAAFDLAEPSLCEAWLRNPGGAVAFVASSRTDWVPPQWVSDFYAEVLGGHRQTLGDAFAHYKMIWAPWCGSNGVWRWLQFSRNLLGDPAAWLPGQEAERDLHIESPNGCEQVKLGSSLTVRWNASGSDFESDELVALEYSDDSGETWQTIPGAEALPFDGRAFTWAAPTLPIGTHYRVRVTSLTNPHLSDASDRDFTIGDLGLLAVQSTPVTDLWITGTHSNRTDYTYSVLPGEAVTLTAPSVADHNFTQWADGGGATLTHQMTLSFVFDTDLTVVAEYEACTGPRDYYVNDEIPEEEFGPGDDENDGLSPATPMRHIQAVLDRYSDVRTVFAAPGTYTEHVRITEADDGVQLVGAGSDASIIDGEQSGRCLYLRGDFSVTVRGFTIRNGLDYEGGGVYAAYGSWVMDDCVFTSNAATTSKGGAIYTSTGVTELRDCTFLVNNAPQGAGVYVYGGSATIAGCRFEGNDAASYGGGLYLYHGQVLVTGCTFAGDSAGYDAGACYADGCEAFEFVENDVGENSAARNGGALLVRNCGEALVSGSDFVGNSATGDGGALRTYGNELLVVSDNRFQSNQAASEGGAICVSDVGQVCVLRNAFESNSASLWGGAVFARDGAPEFANCTFALNHAPRAGAVVYGGVGYPRLVNCLFAGNEATQTYGGAFLNLPGGIASVTNCTMVANWGEVCGGGVVSYGACTVANCVLWGNSAPLGAQAAVFDPGVLGIDFCAVESGAAGVYVSTGATLEWGDHNIDADPLFVAPGNDDFRLSCDSPCIDAGDNVCVPLDELDLDGDGDTTEKIPYDLMGLPRFIDRPETPDTGNPDPDFPDLPIVDMGAYEFQACDGDLDCDGDTDHSDLGILLGDWGCTGGDCAGDLDGDGDTDHSDLGILLGNWGCGT